MSYCEQNAFHAAEDLQVRLLPGNRAALTWRRPHTGPHDATAYSFRVLMQRQGGDGSWTKLGEDKDLLEFETGPLAPVTTFHFCIQSYGIRGDGPRTAPVALTTGVAGKTTR